MAIHDVYVPEQPCSYGIAGFFFFYFQISQMELRFHISRLSFTERSWKYDLKPSIVGVFHSLHISTSFCLVPSCSMARKYEQCSLAIVSQTRNTQTPVACANSIKGPRYYHDKYILLRMSRRTRNLPTTSEISLYRRTPVLHQVHVNPNAVRSHPITLKT